MRKKIAQAGISAEVIWTDSPAAFREHLATIRPAAIVLDNGVPGLSGPDALAVTRAHHPETPIIMLSATANDAQIAASLEAGVTEYVLKGQWWQFIAALRRVQQLSTVSEERTVLREHDESMGRLLAVVQELSLARDLPTVMRIVRSAARRLTGADGATFVLREEGKCYYADEDAIEPLWKGARFEEKVCIGGWVMREKRSVAIADVFADPRIPHEGYRKTFVKSMVMAPIRKDSPLGAIGVYWRTEREPTGAEIEMVEMLANSAALAFENLQAYADLERRVRARTLQLQDAVKELEAFAYSVCHDLRSPLHTVRGFAELVVATDGAGLSTSAREYLGHIQDGVERMSRLVDDLLRLAQIGRAELEVTVVDLSAVVEEVLAELRRVDPDHPARATVQPGLMGCADAGLIRIALQNLLSNAWKYSSRVAAPHIEFGATKDERGEVTFYVRDNGAGFDQAMAERLFVPFQRLHSNIEFAGTGVGLATVQRIIHRHAGDIWATAAVGQGATFYFRLPERN
jgi:signal transduction histidine kinase/CheY-like chemotaxis protein